MKKARLTAVLSLMVAVSIAPPLPAQCPPYVENYYTYYSDYFSTAVGGYAYHCDDSYSEWGTLAGPYVRENWYGCGCFGGTQSGTRCYSNNNGTWTQITCP